MRDDLSDDSALLRAQEVARDLWLETGTSGTLRILVTILGAMIADSYQPEHREDTIKWVNDQIRLSIEHHDAHQTPVN